MAATDPLQPAVNHEDQVTSMERMVRVFVIVTLVFILANVMAPWVISKMQMLGLLESTHSETQTGETEGS